MDDMKDKFKGFMKKVNTQLSSSSSGKFKGHGRVLGTASSSSSSSSGTSTTNPIHSRYAQPVNTKPISSTKSDKSSINLSSSNSQSSPKNPPNSDTKKPAFAGNSTQNREPNNGFDPFDSLITTGKRSQNGYSLNVFECPVCGKSYRSEEEVSLHLESCVSISSDSRNNFVDSIVVVDGDGRQEEGSKNSELESCVGAYLSVKPPEKLEIMLKLLRNVVKEPENAKFRRIRMGNPKIREAVSEVTGGVQLLEFVGFELKEESGELWAVIEEVPSLEKIDLFRKLIGFLESGRVEKEPPRTDDKPSVSPAKTKEQLEPQKIDRQIRVFFAVPESVAAKIELPDSFYNLSADELKREADMRKKKIAESQLLIPKSYKKKQAKAARKRYTRTIIRIQFPDGVVLQGVFAPWESTSALYEFVSRALKDPGLEFELLDPIVVKRGVIPHFPAAGEKARALEDEDLVPSALIKFRPIESDSSVFTGLSNELLQISEPLN